jgi:gamma-glutamylcyclotransferase (GGCT)/AIG2-like uncharacterized protein YtfP
MHRRLTAMALIFSYGTLQRPEVQLATFGRRLEGGPDEIVGFESSLAEIEHEAPAGTGKRHHANLTWNGRPESRVSGTVFEVVDAELAAADEYERRASYTRVSRVLASGRKAWVYLHIRSAGAIRESDAP